MLLRIQVKANSKTDSISVTPEGIIRVKIRAQPVEGKANKYLVEYLAEIFRLPKSGIEITKGHSSAHKTISLNAGEAYIKDVLKSLENNS